MSQGDGGRTCLGEVLLGASAYQRVCVEAYPGLMSQILRSSSTTSEAGEAGVAGVAVPQLLSLPCHSPVDVVPDPSFFP